MSAEGPDPEDRPEGRGLRLPRRHPAPATDPAPADLGKTPGTVIAAVACGVVAAPLLGVYAVLFVSRWFLRPGVEPDITGSWLGEGLAGIVAAALAVALLVVVARAAAGRGLVPFVVAEVLVVAGCGVLLADSADGGTTVSAAVGLLAVVAVGCALLPGSRRWFAAHARTRAEEAGQETKQEAEQETEPGRSQDRHSSIPGEP